MTLPKRYNPRTAESALRDQWLADGVYHFDPAAGPIFSIDTPPPTVSGHLHLGHVYSYSQTDFMARFWRMNGRAVFYPMGFDDNGLPTERLVEKTEQVKADNVGRAAFITRCLNIGEEAETAYKTLWQRLGLSIDWRYSYRTISDNAQSIAQRAFIALFHAGRAYQQQAPAIWCPECQTAIAQAEVNDLDRESRFYTLAFGLPGGDTLPIATTRPELLAACVAVFVHPEDGRFTHLIGQEATVPHFNRTVPILADPGADPEKGTGAVMCCTFGDQADVAWQRTHNLPLIEVMGRDGRLLPAAGDLAGLTIGEARQTIVAALAMDELLLAEQATPQSVRVHERCDTPVEYIVTTQWFYRLLDMKAQLLTAGDQITWQPAHMGARYRQWVEALAWDWCISRQRTFGVPIPIWTCAACGEMQTPNLDALPVDPTAAQPKRPCSCGSAEFIPETDVMDTWATSSMSPHIVGQWLQDDNLHAQLFPFSLRPQAHEIIRTWAFYTIAQSLLHFGAVPFDTIAISGWGLAPDGASKISKSRGGGPMAPLEMIEKYSADAVRYWAASTGFGRDAVISEEKIQAGAKLVTKLWNVARFSGRFLADGPGDATAMTPADQWIVAQAEQLTARVTALMAQYDYATAKSEIEAFFWKGLADNYLEMAKLRLYGANDGADTDASGARFALRHALLTTVKLLAPFLPFVTERIYQGLFADTDGAASVHRSRWPVADAKLMDEAALAFGDLLVEIATTVRRYKSAHELSLGAELAELRLATPDAALRAQLASSAADLQSITRAQEVRVGDSGMAGETAVTIGNQTVTVSIRA